MYERVLNVVWILLAAFFGGFAAKNGLGQIDYNAMLIGSATAVTLTIFMLYATNSWISVVVFFAFLLTTGFFVFTHAALGSVLMQGLMGAAGANLICQMLRRKKKTKQDGDKPE